MTDEYSFENRLTNASTIPAHWYTSDEVCRKESAQIFGKTWQLAGRQDRVVRPGDYFTTHIGAEPLIIVMGTDLRLRVLSNVCRHRAGPVTSGWGVRSVFQCGYHGWTYGLDGRLIGCPEFEGVEHFVKEENRLPEFRVESRDGFIFVNLDPSSAPLNATLDGLGSLPGYQPAARKDWFIDCNWKVYVDNYLEGYHIPIVHPSLNRDLDYTNYRTEIRQFLSLQRCPIRHAEGFGEVRYYWIFPNLMINVYPDNFSTNLVVPRGTGHTQTIFEWYFPDPDKPEVQDAVHRAVEISDRIQREDISICESVQRGLRSSTYTNGRYSVKRESGVHHFHGLLWKFLNGY